MSIFEKLLTNYTKDFFSLKVMKKKIIRFIYKPLIGGKHKVFVAGDFNNWNQNSDELREKNGIYQLDLELEKERYEYKFLVDDNWVLDESAQEFCDDKYGGRNSVITVGNYQEIKIAPNDFETPDWVKDGIFYQIFTDRFYNGNKQLNPDFSEWYYQPENKLLQATKDSKFRLISDWNEIDVLKEDKDKHFLFYGGDLAGVRKKVKYLKDLGITIIYFNPLVKSTSNHKYDAYDYFKIDPHFGTNDEFISLVKELHQNGIKVIVDFAFNHVGLGFFAFQDCLTNGEKSKYYNWFDWHKWPIPNEIDSNFEAKDYYQCWWGYSIMPDLNFDLSRPHPQENYIKDKADAEINKPVVNYILEVAEFWLITFDIDGFRLDIPNEVPFWFWEMFRKKVKKIKPDAYLVGEIWNNSTEWVNNKYFDAVMNYKHFKDPLYNFFIEDGSSQVFAETIAKGLQKHSHSANLVMMNLLDSHDTFRFLESANGNIISLKLAVLFQMTFVGTPHIFYGDEIGMTGGYDPDNRRPFNWEYTKNPKAIELHNWYKKMIKLRHKYSSLRRGTFHFISVENNLVAYKRVWKKEELIIIINKSANEQKCDFIKNKYYDLIQDRLFLENIIPPFSGVILRESK